MMHARKNGSSVFVVSLATAIAVLLTWLHPAFAQIKAFPQAEGFGAEAKGGRGGDVYHVTSLLDNGAPGTLRHGIVTAPATGRTIVFDVGGWINLGSKLGVDTRIRNLTIAGQTAPGGIGVRGNQFSVGGDDIIIRHMRFRPGKNSGRNDSVNTNNNAERVMYDHISAGFSYDENFSVQATDVTLQYSTVSYGLQDHSAGSLLENPRRLTMHHNLYAHNHTRNPKARVFETLDWVNNVVYDFNIGFHLDGTDSAGYFWTQNIDGNYYITGPGDVGNKIVTGGSFDDYGTWWGVNAYDGDGDANHDGVEYVRSQRDLHTVWGGLTSWSTTPYPVADAVWKDASPQDAYERVLSEFGATPWARDEVDQRLYDNVVNRTGTIISHENQLAAQGVSNGGFGTLGGVDGPPDTDGDGMPDTWEIQHGLSTTAADNNGDFDDDGYTNLEEYLNDVGAFKAVGLLEFDGTGRYADWGNWTRRWEPSRLDDVNVNVGTAVVDAVGQKAGTLHIGAVVDGNGTLEVTDGWILVTNDLFVGGSGTGSVDHTGGRVTVAGGAVQIDKGTYQLTGGELHTPLLARGEDGSFEFTGGKLHADEVDFDLDVNGGVLSPGDGIGTTHINGDVDLTGSTLQIEIIAGRIDSLVVAGTATLGGSLEIETPSGAPDSGSWEIISAASIEGSFNFVTDGFYIQKMDNRLMLQVGALPLIEGDFNGDSVVNAADYVVWRNKLGTLYGMNDYYKWKMNYGATARQGVGHRTSVPEPAALTGTLFVPLVTALGWRRGWPRPRAERPAKLVPRHQRLVIGQEVRELD